jgi:hypothetical protein
VNIKEYLIILKKFSLLLIIIFGPKWLNEHLDIKDLKEQQSTDINYLPTLEVEIEDSL